jgi:ubiquinol-cytochrome c reductase cytochrome b subunit
VIALMGGLLQINPIWLFGPYEAAVVSAATQPDWYVMVLDGAIRLMPAWEITIPIGDGYVIPPMFWPAVVLPGILTMLPIFYPFIEARLKRDNKAHNLLQRPHGAGRHGGGVLPGADAFRRQRRDR